MINKATRIHSPFISSLGRRRGNINYAYADVVAGEILVGSSSDTERFFTMLGEAMEKTRDLVIKFTDNAEDLIAYHLKAWGFTKE